MDKPISNLKKIIKATSQLTLAANYSVWPDSYDEGNSIDHLDRKELERARDLINSVLVQYD